MTDKRHNAAMKMHEEILRDSGMGPYASTKEAAAALSTRRETISRLVSDGSLRATRINRSLRIPRKELARFLALGEEG